MRFFRSRTGKIVSIATVLIAVPSIALAVWFLNLGITGKARVGNASATYTNVSVVDSLDTTCTATLSGDAKTIDVNLSDSMPGAYCDIKATALSSSSIGNLVFQSVKYGNDPMVKAGFVPNVANGIAQVCTPTGTILGGATPFAFRVQIDPATPMGTTIDTTGTGSGIQIVRSKDYVAANCNTL